MSNLIRFYCTKCGEYLRGGSEDKVCPLCGGKLIIHSTGVKE